MILRAIEQSTVRMCTEWNRDLQMEKKKMQWKIVFEGVLEGISLAFFWTFFKVIAEYASFRSRRQQCWPSQVSLQE